MSFPTKIAVLLRDDLQTWQRCNVTAFLSSGVAAALPELIGTTYVDGSGAEYLPLFGQPVMVFEGAKDVLSSVHGWVAARGLPMAVFTSDMFTTGNDEDNRAVVAAVPTDSLDLVGIAVHGPRNAVDKVVKGARIHP